MSLVWSPNELEYTDLMTASETLAAQMKMYLRVCDWEICPQQGLKQMNWSSE